MNIYNQGVIPPILLRHRLRIARTCAGLEQGELAEKIGVSRTTISNAEKGRTEPLKVVLIGWANACEVSLDWLITGKPEIHVDKDGNITRVVT